MAAFPLMLGHLLLTSTIDLPILLGVVLLVVKAVDGQPKSWLAAGVLAGAAAYNRLLVVALLAGRRRGVARARPARHAAYAVAMARRAGSLVVAAPQIAYQAGHEQVATAYHRAGDADILTSNYGEAGAVARFGPAYGLPAPVSGHNALADLTMPTRDRVLVLGGAWCDLAPAFARCERVGELDNGVDVDNEEQ